MTSDNVPAGSGAGRGLRIALMVSLAVNILIIGGVATTLLCFGGKGHHHGREGLMGFVRTLPADRAEAIGEKLKADREVLPPLRAEHKEGRLAARAALTAAPFDEAAFRSALDRAANASCEEKKARLSVLASMAASLTQEERMQLHQWFEERRRRFRHKYKQDGDDEPSSSSE